MRYEDLELHELKHLAIEELRIIMALSTEYQAQLTRLSGYVTTLEAAGSADAAAAAKDAEDTAALTAALDAAGAPPVPAADPAPTEDTPAA